MKARVLKDFVIDNNSMIDDNENLKSKFIRPLRRQGALNEFNARKCEFILNEQIEKHTATMKDKSSLYYKRVERMLNYDDRNSTLNKMFGYKCKLVRDLQDGNTLYDIIIPVEISVGKEKLRKWSRDYNRYYSIQNK